jgi:hypothetical protein
MDEQRGATIATEYSGLDDPVATAEQCMLHCQSQLEEDIITITTRFDELHQQVQVVDGQLPASRCGSRARLQEALQYASTMQPP